MKKGLLAIILMLCLTSCTNVVIWTPGQVIGLFCLGLLVVVIVFMYIKYRIENWWKNRKK